MDLNKAHVCVEAICRNGCDAVRASIAALEQGLPAVGTEHLNERERAAVLRKLIAALAAYEQRAIC